jgi:RND family efflux transporter MFP subunit
MNRRTIYNLVQAAVALVLMTVLILWLSGVFEEKIEPGRVPPEAQRAAAGVPTANVELVQVPVFEEASGTVQAERKTIVSARILGVISEVRVRAGDRVEQDDMLVRLDDREARAKMEEASRALQGAEAGARKAQNDYERARKLLETGVVSRSELDQAEAAFKIQAAAAEQARQALEAARVNLSYTEVRAPVAGRIVDRFADPGDTATPGKPLLSLYDPSALRIEAAVREALVSRIRVGDRLDVRLGAEESTLPGTVDEIVPQAEAGSRTFLIKVGLPKRPEIYTGMFGRVVIPSGERERVLVPRTAIESLGQLRFAYAVGPDREIERRMVTLGPVVGDRIEVLSGLRPGETVILEVNASS